MILEVMKFGHPVLRAPGQPVGEITDTLRDLARDMVDTMRDANGVGLAAQQVGEPLQLMVIDIAGVEDRPSEMLVEGHPVPIDPLMPMVLLNPSVDLGEEKETGNEGCLSFPELSGDIRRSLVASVRARTLDGGEIAFEARGFLARVIQHEADHLRGVLFIDRMSSAARAGLAGRLKRLKPLGEQQAKRGPGHRQASGK